MRYAYACIVLPLINNLNRVRRELIVQVNPEVKTRLAGRQSADFSGFELDIPAMQTNLDEAAFQEDVNAAIRNA